MNKFHIILAAVLVVIAGCGNPDRYGREPIEGSVTLHGQRIPDNANIGFSAEDGRKLDFVCGGSITNGRYRISREFGLPPGKYRARISMLESIDPAKTPPPTKLPDGTVQHYRAKDLIPAPFSTEGIPVEIVAGKTNVFDFDIP